MNVVILIVAGIIFIVGALTRPTKIEIEEPSTILEDTTQQPTPLTPWKDANLPSSPTPSPTLAPTQKDANLPSSRSLQNFQYPGSRIVTQNETALILESNADADAITDWYKEKIKARGMNAKSFVVTKTNGNVLNKLVGSDGKTEIRVEITKSASENIVRITVTIQGA